MLSLHGDGPGEGVPPGRYTSAMATSHPRIQVTVDPELAAALASVDPTPASRAGLVRELAIRGAGIVAVERREASLATELLLAIADGDDGYDLAAPLALHAGRADRLP